MKKISLRVLLRLASLSLVLTAGCLVGLQWSAYQRAADVYPAGEVIAGLQVGGLDRAQAAERLRVAYGQPLQMDYRGASFLVLPEQVGFLPDVDAMLASTDARPRQSFWDYLWARQPVAGQAALQYSLDAHKATAYLLNEIAPRYDDLAVPSMPVPGDDVFQPGKTGSALDAADAVPRIEAAVQSLSQRTVALRSRPVDPARTSLQNLQVMLRQILAVSGYDGLAEIYLADLQTGEKMDFAVQAGQEIEPGVAFTAASTVKIPVLVSVFRRAPEPVPEDVLRLVRAMIEASDNPSTDLVVQTVIDPVRGPLEVTRDLQVLGLKNSFWAGYFYDGAPLLDRFDTPASRRTDVNTAPDLYNQTTAGDVGDLLSALHACAQTGRGPLVEAFPGEITQAKCQQMVEILRGNLLPVLVKAGVPEGTLIGHKHGWVQGADGLLHVIADAALVYSPGGDYVMTVYLYRQEQLLFDPANVLVAKLSRAVYGYFNPPQPEGEVVNP